MMKKSKHNRMLTFQGINSHRIQLSEKYYNEFQIISSKMSTQLASLYAVQFSMEEIQQIPIYPRLQLFFSFCTSDTIYVMLAEHKITYAIDVASLQQNRNDSRCKSEGEKSQQQQQCQRCAESTVVWINDTLKVNRSCKFMQAVLRIVRWYVQWKNPNKTKSIDFYFPVSNLQWLCTEHSLVVWCIHDFKENISCIQ